MLVMYHPTGDVAVVRNVPPDRRQRYGDVAVALSVPDTTGDRGTETWQLHLVYQTRQETDVRRRGSCT